MTHEPEHPTAAAVKPVDYRPALPAPPTSHPLLRALIWTIAVLLVAGVSGLIYYRIHTTATAAKAGGRGAGAAHNLPVVVATVRKGSLPVYLYGLGTVTPLKTVNLRTRVDGAITQINYTEGQHVKAGDFLLQIDPLPYQAALDQAKGQLAKDKATKESADWNVQQDQLALQTNSIAQQQLHTDVASRDSAAGSIEVDQANIDAAQVNLTYCRITSPITGVIGLRLVDLGNIVHAADTTSLAVITQVRPITVIFHLREDDVDQVLQRMRSGKPVTVDAFDRDNTRKLATGTVLAVDNVIDPTTGTFAVKAQFDNSNETLYPSEFVNAYLLVDRISDAGLVPAAAIQHDANGESFVYLVGADNAVKMQKVTTAGVDAITHESGEQDLAAVTAGLEAGQTVVTDGVDKLIDGMKVVPHAAAAGARRGTTRPTTGASEAPAMNAAGAGESAADQPDAAAAAPTTRPHRHRHDSAPPADDQ